MTKFAIQVEGLGKEYAIGGAEQPHESFREMLTGALRSPFRKLRRLGGNATEKEKFWALRDISFSVDYGEAVGIIGRNGAGKSTLLKVLSRITSPTTGQVVTRGRLSSLLEVGTGFHPELTGRENVYLNGAILGMSRSEIDVSFDEIVEFAGISKFLDTPVKRYSSGMYVRLAFSVAAHLKSEILLVDEVLAVGDASFQKKCLGKMSEVSDAGRTVIFVSHNLGAISTLCNRGLVLEEGRLMFCGSSRDAVRLYQRGSISNPKKLEASRFVGDLRDVVQFEQVLINGSPITDTIFISPDEEIVISLHGTSSDQIRDFDIHVSLFFEGTQLITLQDSPPNTPLARGKFVSEVRLDSLFLRPGTYSIGIGGYRPGGHQWLWGADIAQMTVLEHWSMGYDQRSKGIVNSSRYGTRMSGN